VVTDWAVYLAVGYFNFEREVRSFERTKTTEDVSACNKYCTFSDFQ